MAKKYLDYNGLAYLWTKIKAYVDAHGGGGSVTVDSALSSTSTNPVQNKVINTALNGKVSTTGNASISGTLTLGGHSSEIGATLESHLTSNKALPSGASTQMLSLSLPAGRWHVECGVRYPTNATGFRCANLSTTSAYSDAYNICERAVSGYQTILSFSRILTPTSTTTYYLNAYQNSGSELTMTSSNNAGWGTFIQAIRTA